MEPICGASGLAARFARGDADALSEVITLYAPRVSALAFRLMGYRGDLDDLVQDVFVAALESRRRFRGDSSLWTWLTAITLNRCRSHARRQRVHRLAMRWLWPGSAASPSDHAVVENETAVKVRESVAALDWKDRELIVLNYFEQMSLEQMGEILNRKAGTIAVQLHRARERLKQLLPEKDL